MLIRILILILSVFFISTAMLGQTAGKRASVSEVLLARSNAWVETWNKKDVRRMRQLHAADLANQLYGIGEELIPMNVLFDDIEKENFWGASWAIKIENPRVRMLGTDSALVAFNLRGSETDGRGGSKRYSGAYTLTFQRQKNDWKIVHVHSSHGPVPGSAPKPAS